MIEIIIKNGSLKEIGFIANIKSNIEILWPHKTEFTYSKNQEELRKAINNQIDICVKNLDLWIEAIT